MVHNLFGKSPELERVKHSWGMGLKSSPNRPDQTRSRISANEGAGGASSSRSSPRLRGASSGAAAGDSAGSRASVENSEKRNSSDGRETAKADQQHHSSKAAVVLVDHAGRSPDTVHDRAGSLGKKNAATSAGGNESGSRKKVRVARCLGGHFDRKFHEEEDFFSRSYGLVNAPEVSEHEVAETFDFLLMCSSGFFPKHNMTELCKVARKALSDHGGENQAAVDAASKAVCDHARGGVGVAGAKGAAATSVSAGAAAASSSGGAAMRISGGGRGAAVDPENAVIERQPSASPSSSSGEEDLLLRTVTTSATTASREFTCICVLLTRE